MALVDASRESMLGSKLYNFPSFYGAAADPGTPLAKKPESGRGVDQQAVQQRPLRLDAARQAGAARQGAAVVDEPRPPRLRQSRRGRDLRHLRASPTCSPRPPPARCRPRTPSRRRTRARRRSSRSGARRAWWPAARRTGTAPSAPAPAGSAPAGAGLGLAASVPSATAPAARGPRAAADRTLGVLMLAPALVYIILLVALPFLLALVLSVTNSSAGSLDFSFVGLRNFRAWSRARCSCGRSGTPSCSPSSPRLLVIVLGNILARALMKPFRGQVGRALPHPHAVGGAHLAGHPRLALDLRLHLQRDQLGAEGGRAGSAPGSGTTGSATPRSG